MYEHARNAGSVEIGIGSLASQSATPLPHQTAFSASQSAEGAQEGDTDTTGY